MARTNLFEISALCTLSIACSQRDLPRQLLSALLSTAGSRRGLPPPLPGVVPPASLQSSSTACSRRGLPPPSLESSVPGVVRFDLRDEIFGLRRTPETCYPQYANSSAQRKVRVGVSVYGNGVASARSSPASTAVIGENRTGREPRAERRYRLDRHSVLASGVLVLGDREIEDLGDHC